MKKLIFISILLIYGKLSAQSKDSIKVTIPVADSLVKDYGFRLYNLSPCGCSNLSISKQMENNPYQFANPKQVIIDPKELEKPILQ